MIGMMLDTFEAYQELSAALSPDAAKVVAQLIGQVYRDLASIVTKEEFGELKAVVADLAEAQKRTEERVEELAEAQKRTEKEVAKLAGSLVDTRKMVGGLSDTVGYVLEDRAIHSLPGILSERLGVTVEGRLRRSFVEHPDGRSSELNIFGRGRNQEGEIVTVLGEAKARLSRKHVDAFLKLVARLERDALLEGVPVLLMVTYTVDLAVERYTQGKGITIIPSYELGP